MSDKVVYIWYNVDNGFVFYVGEGTIARSRETQVGRRNKFFIDYIENNKCDVMIIEENLTKEDALKKETYWVNYYKSIGQASCNITNNGKPGVAIGDKNPNYGNGNALRKTYKEHPELKEKTKHIRSSNGRAKKIRVLFNNEEVARFDCIADCSEYLINNNITYPPIERASQRISYSIKKNIKINGYSFEFL